ncbi:PP0621 family protein [Ideonella sp. BN130291]|uniref:PP0621 family protein n=1 Tax=Ideonella sp. BN130291 TaxID=3112940 RepID=UPI002E25C049|nr:PP0621 family protein [Ideonella sp. BN130291]
MKYLLMILVIGVVLWFAVRRANRNLPPRRRGAVPLQTMVRCAQCGVHLPAGEAVADGALYFCSPAHRALGPAAPR